LRSLGHLPLAQPYNVLPFSYAGTEVADKTLLTATDNTAIIDWVLIELRSSTDSKTLVARKAALMRRDGTVVEAATGSTSLRFTGVAVGNYFVSVRHRNHLGVMTAATVPVQGSGELVDFTASATATYGTNARYVTKLGKAFLWAGNANTDNNLIANGVNQDTGVVYVHILSVPENTSFNSNYVLKGYQVGDFNLDGQVIFSGPSNDVDLLITNVLTHPLNTLYNGNYIVRGQLP